MKKTTHVLYLMFTMWSKENGEESGRAEVTWIYV